MKNVLKQFKVSSRHGTIYQHGGRQHKKKKSEVVEQVFCCGFAYCVAGVGPSEAAEEIPHFMNAKTVLVWLQKNQLMFVCVSQTILFLKDLSTDTAGAEKKVLMEKGTPKSGKSPTKIPSTQVQTKKFTARQKQSKKKKKKLNSLV